MLAEEYQHHVHVVCTLCMCTRYSNSYMYVVALEFFAQQLFCTKVKNLCIPGSFFVHYRVCTRDYMYFRYYTVHTTIVDMTIICVCAAYCRACTYWYPYQADT